MVDYWTVMRMNSLQPRTRIGMNFTNKMLKEKKVRHGRAQSQANDLEDRMVTTLGPGKGRKAAQRGLERC